MAKFTTYGMRDLQLRFYCSHQPRLFKDKVGRYTLVVVDTCHDDRPERVRVYSCCTVEENPDALRLERLKGRLRSYRCDSSLGRLEYSTSEFRLFIASNARGDVAVRDGQALTEIDIDADEVTEHEDDMAQVIRHLPLNTERSLQDATRN